jgi:putative FmdB family regulatory protein
MPRYEYRCRTCEEVHEERRSMADADAPAVCSSGHVGAVRLLPVFSTAGFTERSTGAFEPACGAPVAGGCGGGCACHPG